jgi:hypothetical protein
MDRTRDGAWRAGRRAFRPGAGGTLRRMTRSVWFWVGWACLFGALSGLIGLVRPLDQFLLLACALMAFKLSQAQPAPK